MNGAVTAASPDSTEHKPGSSVTTVTSVCSADDASVDAMLIAVAGSVMAAVASAAHQQTLPLVNTERKCADTTGTVQDHWAGHFRC